MILVPEPLVDQSGDIGGIHVRDLGTNFSATDQPVEVGCLVGILLGDLGGAVLVEQLIPILVSCSENFVSGDLL